jgi:hypothetical protein
MRRTTIRRNEEENDEEEQRGQLGGNDKDNNKETEIQDTSGSARQGTQEEDDPTAESDGARLVHSIPVVYCCILNRL